MRSPPAEARPMEDRRARNPCYDYPRLPSKKCQRRHRVPDRDTTAPGTRLCHIGRRSRLEDGMAFGSWILGAVSDAYGRDPRRLRRWLLSGALVTMFSPSITMAGICVQGVCTGAGSWETWDKMPAWTSAAAVFVQSQAPSLGFAVDEYPKASFRPLPRGEPEVRPLAVLAAVCEQGSLPYRCRRHRQQSPGPRRHRENRFLPCQCGDRHHPRGPVEPRGGPDRALDTASVSGASVQFRRSTRLPRHQKRSRLHHHQPGDPTHSGPDLRPAGHVHAASGQPRHGACRRPAEDGRSSGQGQPRLRERPLAHGSVQHRPSEHGHRASPRRISIRLWPLSGSRPRTP